MIMTWVGLAAAASAQSWRGMGRIAGKVTDEGGAPVEGVVVKAFLPEAKGGTEVKTNNKGEWALGGISRGEWQLDFTKPGYEPRQISVSVAEMTRTPPMEIKLKRAAPTVDANVEIRAELEKAAALLGRKSYSGARQIYEQLLAKYPEAHQLHPLIARTYYGENQFDNAIEHLRMALTKDPENIEIKLLLGNILVEQGNTEEGQQLIASIDETKVKEPTTFLNVGIVMLNQNKTGEAMQYLDRTIRLFPNSPDAYYYRGITHLQAGRTAEAKADLQKFVGMAPDAPEAVTAKKILESLKH